MFQIPVSLVVTILSIVLHVVKGLLGVLLGIHVKI